MLLQLVQLCYQHVYWHCLQNRKITVLTNLNSQRCTHVVLDSWASKATGNYSYCLITPYSVDLQKAKAINVS